MPVYRRTLPSGAKRWRIVVWLSGVKHEKLWTKSPEELGKKSDAESEEASWRGDLEREAARALPKASPTEPPTFGNFSRGPYAEHAMVHLGPKTYQTRVHQLSALCALHSVRDGSVKLGEMRLTEFATEHIEHYKLGRLAEGREASTINSELAAFSAVLTYARSLPIPCASPTIKFLPERGKGRVKAWTREQAASFLAAAERHRPEHYPLFLFLAYTGTRKGEALACETSWIDLDSDTLRIEPNDDWQPKDGEPREVPIEPAIRAHLDAAKKSGRRYAFVSRDGTRWATFPRKAFDACLALAGQCEACAAKDAARVAEEKRARMLRARGMKEARYEVHGDDEGPGHAERRDPAGGRDDRCDDGSGRGRARSRGGQAPRESMGPVRDVVPVRGVPAGGDRHGSEDVHRAPRVTRCPSCAPPLTGSPHKFRHTFASLFLANGGDMFALSRILGHASIRTTERIYSHMLPEALDRARGRVNLGPTVGPAALEARKRWAK
jgi:integrase